MELVKEKEFQIALEEVDEILHFMDEELVSKIPNSFKNFIKENKDKSYISNINPYMPLEEQDLRQETQAIISLIYRSYIANEEEKEYFKQKDKAEFEEIEKEKLEKYNPDNIFKNKDIVKEETKAEEVTETQVALAVIEENWIKKIFSKIKDIFSIITKKNK